MLPFNVISAEAAKVTKILQNLLVFLNIRLVVHFRNDSVTVILQEYNHFFSNHILFTVYNLQFKHVLVERQAKGFVCFPLLGERS